MNSINLHPQLDELYKLTEFISEITSKKDFHVDLIVEEVFVNIVKYSKCNYINVNVEFNESTLTIELIDNGFEFNPLLKENPEMPNNIDEAKIGGLGIYLTKELADDISYKRINDENHLTIIKKYE